REPQYVFGAATFGCAVIWKSSQNTALSADNARTPKAEKKQKTALRSSLSLDKMSLANPPFSLLWLGSGGERSKRRGPGLGSGDCRTPGCNSHTVECGGNQQMPEPGFRQPDGP